MQTFSTRLIFPEGKLSDLAKLPSIIMGNIPGGSTAINVLEKYYKQFSGGLPVPVKLIVGPQSLRFEVSAFNRLMSDQAQGLEVLYSVIKRVWYETDSFHTRLSLGMIKYKAVLIETETVTLKLLDMPDITTLYKSNAEKVWQAINQALKSR